MRKRDKPSITNTGTRAFTQKALNAWKEQSEFSLSTLSGVSKKAAQILEKKGKSNV